MDSCQTKIYNYSHVQLPAIYFEIPPKKSFTGFKRNGTAFDFSLIIHELTSQWDTLDIYNFNNFVLLSWTP